MKRNFTEGAWRDLGENMKNRGGGDMKKVKGLVSVILIAILANGTAIVRILHVRGQMDGRGEREE